jgi:hypothetical protein
MACASLLRLAASSVAKFPDNMWAVMDFETCLRVTAVDLMLKVSSSLAMARD